MAVNSLLYPLTAMHVVSISFANLLGNGDFEADPATLGTFWSNPASSWAISSTEAYGGTSQSVYISGRTAPWGGIRQALGLGDGIVPGRVYAFVAFIKLENLAPGFLYHNVQLTIKQTFNDGSITYYMMSKQPRVRPGSWVEVGADFKIPENITEIAPYVQIPETEVNYFFDEASLIELMPDPDWKSKSKENIESLRKARLDINLRNRQQLELCGYTMELVQTRSDFPHGTSVKAIYWTDPAYAFYRDFFYDTFKSEWAVLANALKWRQMEFSEGNLRFDDANATINDLLDHGVTIRGHNMVWGVTERIPNWVQAITDKDVMLDKIKKRINETVDLTRGRLAHWDVNNEALHDDFFESRTENPDVTKDMFTLLHAADPDVELFLNDFSVVHMPQYTTAMKNQAQDFVDSNTPIHGVGVQCHFSSSDIDMTQVKYRLDKVAEAGLPIWVTELSVSEINATLKAEALENVLTMFFGHPSVKGVIIWGFWGKAIYDPDYELAEGTDSLTLNVAGERYIDLVNRQWRTNWTDKLKTRRKQHYFKGDYTFNIKKNGVVVESLDINLTQTRSLLIEVVATDDAPELSLKYT